jgi:hypothetical protein
MTNARGRGTRRSGCAAPSRQGGEWTIGRDSCAPVCTARWGWSPPLWARRLWRWPPDATREAWAWCQLSERERRRLCRETGTSAQSAPSAAVRCRCAVRRSLWLQNCIAGLPGLPALMRNPARAGWTERCPPQSQLPSSVGCVPCATMHGRSVGNAFDCLAKLCRPAPRKRRRGPVACRLHRSPASEPLPST